MRSQNAGAHRADQYREYHLSGRYNKFFNLNPKFIVLEDFFGLEKDDFVTYENFYKLKIKFKFHNLELLIKSIFE